MRMNLTEGPVLKKKIDRIAEVQTAMKVGVDAKI